MAEKVDKVLDSPALEAILRIPGISIADRSKPKQTETTRRWKLDLKVSDRDRPVRTKIEFSGRDTDEDRFEIEAIPARIVAPYALRAPSIQHYLGDAMAEQKVLALAERSQTQARDVFDLDFLLRRYPLVAGVFTPTRLDAAIEQALALPYDAFRDQVLPFLEPDLAEDYADPGIWDSMQTSVVEKLEAAK